MAPPSPDDIVLLDMMIRGRVILPDTIEYECQLKKMHDVAFHANKPLFFILCHDIVDVKEALAFVVKHDLPLSVRSGGHSPCGSSCRDGSVVLDLAAIRHVNYDATTEKVAIGPGATLSDLNVELLHCGRMTPLGVAPPTGCGGLVMHGGVGWLANRFGTSVDNVTDVTMILADGTIKELNENSQGDDRELFFGVHGAAGILGVVMSFSMRTYPMELMTGGFWMMKDNGQYSQTRVLTKKFNSIMMKQEEADNRNLFGAVFMANFPPDPSIPEELHGMPCTLMFVGVWGTDEAALALANEFIDRDIVFGKPPAPMPFGIFNQILSGMFLRFPPFSSYWKGQMLGSITDDKIDEFADKWATHEPFFNASLVGFEFTGGKAGTRHGKKINEGNDHCISSLRDYVLDAAVFLYFPPGDPAIAERAKTYARELAAVVEDLKNTSYTNFASELVSDAETKRELGLTYNEAERVQDLKKKVDPNCVFVRKNIPAAQSPPAQ